MDRVGDFSDRRGLESFGEQLRSIGHRRHELANRVFEHIERGGNEDTQALYRELADVTGRAVSLMQQQLDIFGEHLRSGERGHAEHTGRAVAAAVQMGQFEQAQEITPQLTDMTGQGTDPVPRPRA